jgi:hypothetical protein
MNVDDRWIEEIPWTPTKEINNDNNYMEKRWAFG